MVFVKQKLEWDEPRAQEFVRSFHKLSDRTRQEYMPAFAQYLSTILPADPASHAARVWEDKWLNEELHTELLMHDPLWITHLLPHYQHWDENRIDAWLIKNAEKDWWDVALSQKLCVLPSFCRYYKEMWNAQIFALDDEMDPDSLFTKHDPAFTVQLFKWWRDDLKLSDGMTAALVSFCLLSQRPHLLTVVKHILDEFEDGSPSPPWQGLCVLPDNITPALKYVHQPHWDHAQWVATWERAFGPTPEGQQDKIFHRLFFHGRLFNMGEVRTRHSLVPGTLPPEEQFIFQEMSKLFSHWYADRTRRQALLSGIAPGMTDFSLQHFIEPLLDNEDLVFLMNQDIPSRLKRHPSLERAVLHQHLPTDKPSSPSRKM